MRQGKPDELHSRGHRVILGKYSTLATPTGLRALAVPKLFLPTCFPAQW